jgi:plastocyanin
MRGRALLGCGLAAIASTLVWAIAAPASSGADATNKTPVVTVADDFFAPTDVKVPKGSKVKWVWDSYNTDTHNVVLGSKHPKDVKANDFRSPSGAVGLTYAPKLKVPGTYEFICTYHKSVMRMDVKVTK